MIVLRLELVCAAIVAVYVAARLRKTAERGAFLARFVLLAAASFCGEDSVIRAYGYYAYARGWSVRIDHVPLMIVLVWPVVIDSAASLARRLVGEGRPVRVANVAALLVLADASLIEPVAVRAGLWRWTAGGLFGVPLVGIAGWAMFAWAAIALFERDRARGGVGSGSLAVLVVAPVFTHAAILASWWALFRHVGPSIPPVAAVVGAWLFAVPAMMEGWKRGRAVPLEELVLRLPGALFFFALLALTRDAAAPFPAPHEAAFAEPPSAWGALTLYAFAFAPPYLAAMLARHLHVRSVQPSDIVREKT